MVVRVFRPEDDEKPKAVAEGLTERAWAIAAVVSERTIVYVGRNPPRHEVVDQVREIECE